MQPQNLPIVTLLAGTKMIRLLQRRPRDTVPLLQQALRRPLSFLNRNGDQSLMTNQRSLRRHRFLRFVASEHLPQMPAMIAVLHIIHEQLIRGSQAHWPYGVEAVANGKFLLEYVIFVGSKDIFPNLFNFIRLFVISSVCLIFVVFVVFLGSSMYHTHRIRRVQRIAYRAIYSRYRSSVK